MSEKKHKNRIFTLLFSLIFFLILLYGCDGIFPFASKPTVPSDHTDNISGAFHRPEPQNVEECTECHGQDLKGGVAEFNGSNVFASSCYQCHGDLWTGRGGGVGGNKK